MKPSAKLAILGGCVLAAMARAPAAGDTGPGPPGDGDGTAGWGPVELVERVRGRVDDLFLAVDREGGALLLWERDDGPGEETIWASLSRNGAGWSVPEPVELARGRANNPSAAFAPDGSALVVWEQQEGHWMSIWSARHEPGRGWRSSRRVEDRSGDAFAPSVAVGRDGIAVAVWVQAVGNRFAVHANRHRPGRGWGEVRRIGDAAGAAQAPRLAVDDAGNALVVWAQRAEGGTRNVYAAGTGPGGVWRPAEPIEDAPDDAAAPRLAMDGRGHGTAVWEHAGRRGRTIAANRYVAGRGWGRAAQIEFDLQPASHPDVGVDRAGRAVAIWIREFGEHGVVSALRYDTREGWRTAPEPVAAGTAQYTYRPRIAMGRDGVALVVWPQTDVARNNLWANRYVPETGWGMAAPVERRNGTAATPAVAALHDGSFRVAWKMIDGMDPDTAFFTVWSRTYR